MKKAITLAVLGLLTLGVMASASTSVVLLKTGQNLIAASLVPYDPTPSTCFRDDFEPSMPIDLHLKLQRWNASNQSYVPYNKYQTSLYGKVLLGDGAWLKNPLAPVFWVYEGVPNGVPDGSSKKTDMWISLPKAGNTLIGNPFYESIVWANCLMTDGNVTITVTQAKGAPYNWTTGIAKGWNTSTNGYYDVRVESYAPNQELLKSQGYWIKTNVNNLALIIPAKIP